MNSLIQSSRKFLFKGLVILFFAGCINNTEPPEMQTIDIKSLNIVRVRPGSPPELLEILISGNIICPFKNVSNENFRISPAQIIRDNKIIYLVEPVNLQPNLDRLV